MMHIDAKYCLRRKFLTDLTMHTVIESPCVSQMMCNDGLNALIEEIEVNNVWKGVKSFRQIRLANIRKVAVNIEHK